MEQPKKTCQCCGHVGEDQTSETDKELALEAAVERRLDMRYRRVDETDPLYDG